MNGTKDEKCTQNLCCHNGLRLVYLGMILFLIGLLAQGSSVPVILMLTGLLVLIVGTITQLSRK